MNVGIYLLLICLAVILVGHLLIGVACGIAVALVFGEPPQ